MTGSRTRLTRFGRAVRRLGLRGRLISGLRRRLLASWRMDACCLCLLLNVVPHELRNSTGRRICTRGPMEDEAVNAFRACDLAGSPIMWVIASGPEVRDHGSCS